MVEILSNGLENKMATNKFILAPKPQHCIFYMGGVVVFGRCGGLLWEVWWSSLGGVVV